jgi:L-rhamnose-H+ transport protein
VAVGSLAPLIVSHAEKLAAPQGRMIVAANAVMIAGIVLSALAGKARDEARDRSAAGPRTHAADFRKGLLASIAAALLSSLFNIALAYGGEFNRLAVEAGASPLNAANAQWAFTVTFGYLPNIVLSLLALSRRHLWTVYGKSALSHWLWPPVMGAMWIGGTALYGSAATALGKLGPVIGWPIYMSVMITVGSMWGWLTGEWAGAPSRAINRLVIGIAIQVAAIAMLSAVSQ